MMAVVVDRFGGPEVLDYRRVPVPEIATDEVLIEVRGVSINRTLDLKVRADGNGRAVTLPLVLGVDPTGVVAAVGSEVANVAIGDRVASWGPSSGARCGRCPACLAGGEATCGSRFHLGIEQWGGYAQFVKTPAWSVHLLPEGLAFPEATVIMRHYPMAYRMLAGKGQLTEGDWILVMGSSGALGSAGVEIARALGANVIAGAGADDRVAAGMKMGAHFGVNYRTEDLELAVDRITDGRGVDVVFENIGDPSLFPAAFNCLGYNGRLLTAGSHGGGNVMIDVRRLYHRHLTIYGTTGSTADDVAWALEAGRLGKIHPLIGAVLPLSEAKRAHEIVERNEILGKVILDPGLTL
jgi:NADPH:quinone reductase-like Zn-dependent oxidoreductase